MSTLNKIPLPGYLSPNAPSRPAWSGDIFGNNNYQQGGDKLYATDFGLSGIEWFDTPQRTASGTYIPTVFPPANSMSNNETQAAAWPYVIVKWLYAANSVEVANNTNLNGDGFRVDVRGV